MHNNKNQSAFTVTADYSFLDSEICFLANQIKAKINKILQAHGKGLRTYLKCATMPIDYANSDPELWSVNVDRSLFNCPEIHEFLQEENCPPLWKLVILAELMGRTLVVNISGARSAQIPLHYSDNPNDYISQLWLSIYGLMALMHNGFESFDRPAVLATSGQPDEKGYEIRDGLRALSGVSPRTIAEDDNETWSRLPDTWPDYSDCESLESLILAADHYGFRLDFDFRRPR